MLFKRKKAQEAQKVQEEAVPNQEPDPNQPNPLEQGVPSLMDLLSPGGFDRSSPDMLRVGSMWARTMAVTGLPSEISVGWLYPFLTHDGSLDLSIHVEPYEEREALSYLTLLLTKLRARYRFVWNRSGESADIERAVADVERIRDLVASNTSRLFKLGVAATVYDQDAEEVNRAAALLEGRLAGQRIYSKFLEARQDEAYQTVLPFGMNYTEDVSRNLDSYGMSTVLPFTQADLYHRGGYMFGTNIATNAPIIYDPYDKSLNNHNIVVYAGSGAGKSATIKTHIGRAIFTGERTAVIDPEGEYKVAVEALGGACIPLGPGSMYQLNPFDVTEDEDPDTRVVAVRVGAKVLDLMDLIGTMVGGLDAEEAAMVELSLRQLYKDFGITADPESLYETRSIQDPDNPDLVTYGRQRKRMPQLSDFVEVLSQHGEKIRRVVTALGPYYGDGVLSFFDCQSNVNIDNQWLTVFDLSLLDERLGKPIALQVALTWLWDSFVKKNLDQKKRVIVDEAWLMADLEQGMVFLENCVRRARKRTAGLTVISQDFRKFARHPRGEAIHSNSNTFVFLRAEEMDVPEIKEVFRLSDGEADWINKCGKGQGILRVKGRSIAFRVDHTEFEKTFVFTTPLDATKKGA